MTDQTMIERVARALCQLDRHDPDGSNVLSCGDPFWMFYRDKAKTAITAMREPTEGMLSADPAKDADWSSERDMFWKGMIDAALAEEG